MVNYKKVLLSMILCIFGSSSGAAQQEEREYLTRLFNRQQTAALRCACKKTANLQKTARPGWSTIAGGSKLPCFNPPSRSPVPENLLGMYYLSFSTFDGAEEVRQGGSFNALSGKKIEKIPAPHETVELGEKIWARSDNSAFRLIRCKVRMEDGLNAYELQGVFKPRSTSYYSSRQSTRARDILNNPEEFGEIRKSWAREILDQRIYLEKEPTEANLNSLSRRLLENIESFLCIDPESVHSQTILNLAIPFYNGFDKILLPHQMWWTISYPIGLLNGGYDDSLAFDPDNPVVAVESLYPNKGVIVNDPDAVEVEDVQPRAYAIGTDAENAANFADAVASRGVLFSIRLSEVRKKYRDEQDKILGQWAHKKEPRLLYDSNMKTLIRTEDGRWIYSEWDADDGEVRLDIIPNVVAGRFVGLEVAGPGPGAATPMIEYFRCIPIAYKSLNESGIPGAPASRSCLPYVPLRRWKTTDTSTEGKAAIYVLMVHNLGAFPDRA